MLLKLYLYGYLNPGSVRAGLSVSLDAMSRGDVRTGRLVPDHKTIADFRKEYGGAIRKMCAQFIMLCQRLDLFADASMVIDGSKFKAVNNRDRNFTRARRAAPGADRGERCPAICSSSIASIGRSRHRRVRRDGSLKGEDCEVEVGGATLEWVEGADASVNETISLTDPDSRSMATSGRGSGIGSDTFKSQSIPNSII